MERKLLDMMNQLSISEYNLRMKYCDKFQFANLPFERGEILFSKVFSIYTDIRKLQDKAKTSLTISHTANLAVEKVTMS